MIIVGGKLEIKEYLYPGQKWYSFKIKTHNPWGKVFHKFHKICFHILEISASKFYEDFLMVDDSFTPKGSTSIDYRYYFKYKKPWDEYTKFVIYTKLIGSQDMKTNEGSIEFKFQPYLEIKLPYGNYIQKILTDVYWLIYYRERVNKLKEQSKGLFERLVKEIKINWNAGITDEKVEEVWKESF